MTGLASLPVLAGAVGIAACPGLVRPLADDIAAIAAWRAGLVVSLVEGAEAARLGLGPGGARLAAALRAAGIAWEHLPLPDYGLPDPAAWAGLASLLLARLAAGGRVLLHCRAGRGRSGTIAAGLMVRAGMAPAAAIAAVRAARPGAIETAAQEAFIAAEPRGARPPPG